MSEEKTVFNGVEGKTKEEVWNWTIVDEEGEFAKVPKGLLNVDMDYQRDVTSNSKILEIAKSWSWARAGVIKVAQRSDGTLWVFDGQHRVLAARKRASIKKLPCLIFRFDEKKEEAKAFLDCNLRLSHPKAYQTFKAGLVAEDPVDLAIKRMVESHGYQIGSHSRRTVACIAAMRRAMKTDDRVARDAFALSVKICDLESMPAKLFEGLLYLFLHCRKLKIADPASEDFAGRLCNAGLAGCIRSIDESLATLLRSGPKVYAHGLWKICNKGVRQSKKMPCPG